ncbi:MAG TPA: hypothetical protein VIK69_04290 [Methylophilaceae bacterium]
MSDYAGPVLGAVGAVIGGVVGGVVGAQWGWAIGATLGGMYSASQQVIPGPKIGDVQRQTQQEGGFRPIVYGRSHPIAGNVIADGGPVIVKKKQRQGKGGPKVETESAYRTYAVGFCEGWAELLQVWRNGILVYDAEDPSMAAENAKFLEYATWYPGTFDQPASPDLEEIYGVGQAPYFRGTAYLSLHNEDVTDQRGAWSQWQVRVNTQPPEAYLTSKPYPAYGQEGMGVEHDFGVGALIQQMHQIDGATEQVGVGMTFGAASLRPPVVSVVMPPEEIQLGMTFDTAILRSPLVSVVMPPEEIQPDMTFGTAILREALITQEQAPEEIQTTFTFGEASLYAP